MGKWDPKGAILIACFPKGVRPQNAVFKIFKDVSKRVSTCQVCDGPIAAGPRLIFVQKLARSYKTKQGGTMWERRTFSHVQCLLNDTGIHEQWNMIEDHEKTGSGGPPPGYFNPCLSCHARIPKGEAVHVFTTSRHNYGFLCKNCRALPAWTLCAKCGVYYKTSVMRNCMPINELSRPVMLCKGCSQNSTAYLTLQDSRELRRYHRRIEKKFEDLKERLEEEVRAQRSTDQC